MQFRSALRLSTSISAMRARACRPATAQLAFPPLFKVGHRHIRSDPMRSNFAYDTEALWQQDRDHIIHPWIDLGTAKTREPLIVAEAEGVHIYDSRGHRMIDAIGGMWCVN